MTVFLITMAYVLITLIAGIVVGRRNKNIQEFFVAQGKLNLPLCCVLLMASTFAGAYTSGSVKDAYLVGFAPYLPLAAMGLGYITFIPLVRFYRSMAKDGHISIPEAFAVRFDDRSKTAVLIINSLAYGATFAVQPIAFASIVAPMLGLDPALVAWCATAVMVIMALTGLTGVAWMNTFHCIAMVGGMTIVSFVAMSKAGGLGNIIASVPGNTWNIFQPDVPTMLIRVIALAVCMYASSESATIAISGKSVKTAKIACVTVGVVIFIFSALLLMIGVSAQIIVPGVENPSTVLYVLSSKLGPVFSVISSIAVIAAIMSSAPAYLIYFSTGMTREVVARFFPNSTEKHTKLYSTIFILILALAGPFFAQKATSILNFLFIVFEIMSVSSFVLIIGRYWKRVSAKAAFLSIVISSAITLIWVILRNPFGIMPAWLVVILTPLLLAVFTLCEKKPVDDGYLKMRTIMDKYKDER